MLTCSGDYPKRLLRPESRSTAQGAVPAVPALSSDSGVAFQIVPGATAAYTAGNQMLTRTSPTFPRTAVYYFIEYHRAKLNYSGFNPQPLCRWLLLLILHFCDGK
jgi:hypothetical protein